ncbi:MAG: hypothetical protein U0575_09105 [Phycisphaerales bacterium]
MSHVDVVLCVWFTPGPTSVMVASALVSVSVPEKCQGRPPPGAPVT